MLFAYGTINSGKTFTIQGTSSHPGLLPTLVEEILEVAAMTSRSTGDCELQISMLEIHQEKIYDLLCSSEKKDKLILMDANGRISVSRLSSHVIDSANAAATLINLASSRRLAQMGDLIIKNGEYSMHSSPVNTFVKIRKRIEFHPNTPLQNMLRRQVEPVSCCL